MRNRFLQRHRGLRVVGLAALVAACGTAFSQTITVVGTRHLTKLDPAPTAEQFAHAIEALRTFEPTQVCVERMSGERIQALAADPSRNAMTLQPDTHGRPLADTILPLGVRMQARLAVGPAEAREQSDELVRRWDELDIDERGRLIALQIAGYEFHSAVLNWSHLAHGDGSGRDSAARSLPNAVVAALDHHLESTHEVYALGVPLARRAGLHELCTADALEYETAGMNTALALGGGRVLRSDAVRERLGDYRRKLDAAWRPDGPAALTRLLAFVNSEAFAELDREMQWETLLEHDNESGAFRRRLMFWHARTAQISSELYRALARGPDERVMLVIGAAHRPFTEADLRAQPWLDVVPASALLERGLADAP